MRFCEYIYSYDALGQTYYPLTDVQGTVWGYVDSANNVVARWTYDAWGNVLSEVCTVPALSSIRYRFQGREWSAATGLINFRMRWYDPETGRWLSKDPIGLGGGLNLYAFCGNAPVIICDSFGLLTVSIGLSASGGAVFGGCLSVGLVGSFSWSDGLHLGGYFSGAAGSYIGVGASIGITGAVSGAKTICDLSGGSLTSGSSWYSLLGGGGDFSVPLDRNLKNAVYSGTVGIGTKGGDVHSMPTVTTIRRIF